ncbi:hypothetical protein GCM10020331_048590 [Ectobacillus funiculus]
MHPQAAVFRDEVVTLAAKHGMGTIMWTVDTIDWQRPEPSVLLNRVLTKSASRCHCFDASYLAYCAFS